MNKEELNGAIVRIEMSNEELNSVISREDDEFDKTMQDIKEQLIARIQRQEKEIERLKSKTSCLELEKADFSEGIDAYLSMLDERDDRIQKAIEYLKDTACYEEDTKIFCDDLDTDSCLKLLDILKGKE